MSDAFYKNSIHNFLRQSDDEIFGIIAAGDRYDTVAAQKDAWMEQIRVLKYALAYAPSGSILFEYTLPRVGGRIDNILLINNTVFVLEFKVGAETYASDAIRQVRTYAFDLQNYHEESRQCKIVPILVATGVPDDYRKYDMPEDVILTDGDELRNIIIRNTDTSCTTINMDKWASSRYVPTPTIIEAAEILYSNHSVADIAQNTAAENLTKTSDAVQRIIEHSKQNKQKSICFITGVPGAGKTLAGLNIAIENQKTTGQSYSCFLTGNQPLVSVLREALAADDHRQNGTQITEARNKVKSFIQIIHHFRDASLENVDVPPIDNVVIFDEAQRAWVQSMLSGFMQEKKAAVLNRLTNEQRAHFLSMSEPEMLIDYMNRHQDWAVIVCLVGGGQDINTGEAGIQEWFASLKRSFPDWNVYVSGDITASEYLGDQSFAELTDGLKCETIKELHLSVSLRAHRTSDVAGFVDSLLDNDAAAAAEKYKRLSEVYPIYMTRDLARAKQWVREQTAGKALRHGLIASSNGRRLRADGIWIESKCKPEKWFLGERDDIKSSYFMEEAASEFDIQGLEIDYAVVGWDADYRYVDGKFEYFKPSGSRWLSINQEDKRRYLKNAYRVLLTRAREGFVIFVPRGDVSDATRQPKFYDALWQYLTDIGVEEL